MTIRRLFFRIAVRSLEYMCLLHGPKRCAQSNLSLECLPEDNEHMDIITIAYNNAQIIPLHVEYVKKYYRDEHTHIIADNSSDSKCAEMIRKYCNENNVCYIRLPKNHLKVFSGSYSHATALNWVYKRIVQKRNPEFFGFIDHDLFPVKPIHLTDLLRKQHVYGPKRKRGDYWYLSAIMSFFEIRYVQDKKMDFMPTKYDNDKNHYLDTGGSNWLSIYKAMDESDLVFCSERMERINLGDETGDNRHRDFVELFDGQWVHTINGSYWKQIDIRKESMLKDLIRRYES